MSKVVEKLLKFRILSFLNKHDVLHNRQTGFRKKFCTVYANLDILTECYDNINPIWSFVTNLQRFKLCLFMQISLALVT